MFNGAKLLSALWVMNQIIKLCKDSLEVDGYTMIILSCKGDESSSGSLDVL